MSQELAVDGPVILLDLNSTLSANWLKVRGKPLAYRQANERYRGWLVGLIVRCRHRATILLTVRDESERDWTLASIDRQCGWQPDLAVFRNIPRLTPPDWKEHALRTVIFPRYGSDPRQYLAIESNLETQKMYTRLGIVGLKAFPSSE